MEHQVQQRNQLRNMAMRSYETTAVALYCKQAHHAYSIVIGDLGRHRENLGIAITTQLASVGKHELHTINCSLTFGIWC